MSDLIDRQQAIDALADYIHNVDQVYSTGKLSADDCRDAAQSVLDDLPSAQPDIIYCGDCKYKDDGIDEDGIPFLKCLHGRSYGGTRINDFCSWAERKEVAT